MNYVIFDGKDSRDIKGLLISELPPIVRPKMRVKETAIDGVDGSIIEELGYESYDRTVTIGLKIGADVDKVTGLFTGSGNIVFSNEPDKYYVGTVIQNIDYERLLRYRVAKVTFRVQPFKYERVEVARQATSERQRLVVENIGNHTAKPKITIKGSGTVELLVNSYRTFRYTFPDGENHVVIDSEKQDAYWQNKLKNRNMYGDFPVLASGNNSISWTGAVELIVVEKYSRWL